VLRLGLQPDLLLATPAWIEAHGSLLAALPAGVRLQPATQEALAVAATTSHPDGVVFSLAVPEPPPEPSSDPAAGPPPQFVLALDRLQDPGNLGTLMRTALAAGVEELWLAGGADPHAPKVLRASAGAALALPLRRLEGGELTARLAVLAERGLQLVAAVPPAAGRPQPRPYWELDWTRPTALLLGNEGAGLAPELEALASERVTIPHSRAVESLNVAVAAAPLLLERCRQLYGR
jgi:TrmH family RNA methyltransferase